MVELGWLDPERGAAARASRPQLIAHGIAPRRRGYVLDAAAREAASRFGVDPVRQAGLVLVSGLDPLDQAAAERSLREGLDRLESGGEGAGLQGVVVSADPRSGQIRAYVGGRDYGASQFDRAGGARRQPGSAFKPVVFAAAFAAGLATPATLLDDAPLSLRLEGETWQPQNADRSFRGPVTARRALEQSLNVPTVRLGAEVGWRRVVDLAGRMGVETELQALPSVALGALELTPLDLLSVYTSLAAGGVRTRPRLLQGGFDRAGRPIAGETPAEADRVVPAEAAYQVTHVLEGVMDRGTARSARELGFRDPQAGKTGTTNGGRDSWFAGYSPDRATLVWVGYDDNRSTKLSGSRAALPVWVAFTTARRPASGYRGFEPPPGIRFASIDTETGSRATSGCSSVRSEAFTAASVPTERCAVHGGRKRSRTPTAEGEVKQERRRKPWWKRLFGRGAGGPASLPAFWRGR
jgi:membrane carboxypeptidase/penicillin-binding protein